jgi:hypothetical protein
MKRRTKAITSHQQTILAALSLLAASVVLLALLWLLSSAPAVAAPAAELHVCPSGPPACDFATVQAAVDAAGHGDVIKVATGVYTGVQAHAGITQVVYISKMVAVRGGYTTTDWVTPDPEANPTTLDAQGLGRVLVISGTITPTVEGLQITGGNATGLGGSSSEDDAGGGVYVSTATATISGCTVYSNTASTTGMGEGGGLYLYRSTATLVDNTVQGNTASAVSGGSGGGLCLWESIATIQGNSVVSNTASTAGLVGLGGGIHVSYSTATIQGNTVTGNIAGLFGSGTGGGLCLLDSTAVLQGNVVQGNIAGTGGEGGGGGLILSGGTSTLQSNTIQGNVASTAADGLGGGLYLIDGDATLTGNTIVSNTAALSPTTTGKGGGLYVIEHHSLTLTNDLVAGNQANTEGSGLWFGSYSTTPTPGRLLHTTIADNAGGGQGVYVDSYATLAFTNTIIAGHGVGITVTAGSTATLEGTLWHNNGIGTSGAGTIITGAVNVYDDPAFVDPDAGDYHIGSGSAAIDRGVETGIYVDIDGDPRPIGSSFDLGADEWGDIVKCYLSLVLRH